MDKDALAAFANQNFLNLETYRKNGEAMRTPVWFVEEEGVLYVRTVDGSGKVKRARANPRVRVAPCQVDGKLIGAWVTGTASLLSAAETARVNALFDAKYGELKRQFEAQAQPGLVYTTIAIQ